jgi:hypothetical protein
MKNGCRSKYERTKNVLLLLGVFKRDVTPVGIIVTATYRGHLAWLFYIFGKAKLMGGDLMISLSCQKGTDLQAPQL